MGLEIHPVREQWPYYLGAACFGALGGLVVGAGGPNSQLYGPAILLGGAAFFWLDIRFWEKYGKEGDD